MLAPLMHVRDSGDHLGNSALDIDATAAGCADLDAVNVALMRDGGDAMEDIGSEIDGSVDCEFLGFRIQPADLELKEDGEEHGALYDRLISQANLG